jgi:sialic acid synthase SpsE/sugar phosphate isomerase/epimerase
VFKSKKLEKIFNKENNSVYIICEIGVNHNWKLDTALKLIDAAKDANVDAVKFQKRNLHEIYTDKILSDSNSAEWNFDYLIPLLKECELSNEDYKIIRNKCDDLELDLIITPFDNSSVDFIAELWITAFKIASADMTNFELVEKCWRYNLPIIISTGMWSKEEIETCVNYYNNKKIKFALLHTQSTYPASFESLNLQFVDELKKMTDIIGYSWHERGNFIPIAMVAMGCKIIEKHITFDKESDGPDHKASMLPSEWKEMVDNIRMLEKAMWNKKEITQAEKLNKEAFAKSAVAKSDFNEGHILTKSDIIFRSPGKGIFQHEIEQFYGKVLSCNIKKNNFISKEDFENVILIENWKKFKFNNDWGIKCRFHDFETFNSVDCKIIEFHCSENDLQFDFKPNIKNNNKQLIVHAPEIFDRELLDLCSNELTKVKKSRYIIQKTIDKTLQLSKYFPNHKPKMVIHLGGMSLDKREINDTRKLMDNAIKNFKWFEIYNDVIDIIPENLPSRPWYLWGERFQHWFASAEDMLYFCNHYKLGMTYDICHAYLYCQNHNKSIIEYTKKVMPIVKHVHISDARGISGEWLQIGEWDMDLENIFNEMKKYKFSWVTEVWSGHLHNASWTYKCLKLLEKYSNIL